MNATTGRVQLRVITDWLRSGVERPTGLVALPAHQRERAHRVNDKLGRLVRSRRGR